MFRKKTIILSILSICYTGSLTAAPNYQSQYEGQEKRDIKSLSADDIAQLKSGKGWGLAKAAELNGVPGPSHILQMKDKISLTKAQEKKIQALYDDMQSEAIPLGNKLIELEKRLNHSFANGKMTKKGLRRQLESISKVRTELRYVHLVTHLMTPDILTAQQIVEYNRLRGYNFDDPCKSIPEGHDAEMWKKHNDCR